MRIVVAILVAGLALTPGAGFASTPHDWVHLERLKPGATLIVYGSPSGMPFPAADRCTLLRVDTATLTCVPEGYAGTRLLFPAAQVDRVFEVRESRFSFGAVLALAFAGILIGGLAAVSPEAIVIGFIGLLVGCVATLPPPAYGVVGPFGIPVGLAIYNPPPPTRQRAVLVYERGARP